MNYSQNDEQKTILAYFANSSPRSFLDIGAYHPTELSNTRCLVEKGWGGVYVEPNPDLLPRFEEAYGDNPKIQLLPLCVGRENKEVEFLVASGGNVSWGDAVSTLDPAWTPRWEKAGVTFTPIQREMVTVQELLQRAAYPCFDFISIDTEGNVLEILEQIVPDALGTRLFCVEWNREDLDRFTRYFKPRGYRELYRSAENLIFGR
jgi:FkbM family methyltransferase